MLIQQSSQGLQQSSRSKTKAYLTRSTKEPSHHPPWRYVQVFDMLDTEKTGVLGREQVRRLVQEIDGTELSDEDLDAAMAVMDDDSNGAVDFQEFSAWWIMRTEEDVENEEDESDEDDESGEDDGSGEDDENNEQANEEEAPATG